VILKYEGGTSSLNLYRKIPSWHRVICYN